MSEGETPGAPAAGGSVLTAAHVKVFLACMALGMAVGLGILLARSRDDRPPRDVAPSLPAVVAGTPLDYSFFPMGGIPFMVKAWGRDPRPFMDDATGSEALVEAIEREVSDWRAESVTSRLNGAKVGEEVPITGHVLALLAASKEAHEISRGAFNPAIGPLIELWKEAGRLGKEPAAEEIEAMRSRCSFDAFRFDAQRMVATKLVDGARLDFGGIAKGYAVDRVADFLRARGVGDGIVAAAGDIRVFGGGTSRKVGIRHPDDTEKLYGYFYLGSGGVSTSGNYERFYRIGDKVYGHIMDPRAMRPTEGSLEEGVLSATVIAPDATASDWLATSIFILGADEGLRLAEDLPGVEAFLLVREKGEIRQLRTKGFPNVLDMAAEQAEPARPL